MATSRKHRSKVEKSNEEFKAHERELMTKRISEINTVINKKCIVIWNQYLFHKPKPPNIALNFQYEGLDDYLKVSDCYQEPEHKDPKQKWWNNQKASEMSQDFLPSVVNATDQMAIYMGKQIQSAFQKEFTQYVIFELMDIAISSTFKTIRSGSNEVFLRTSFQYSKSQFRHKLINYFKASELVTFDAKQRKKKQNWMKLIKEKRDKLLSTFLQKKSMINGNNNNNNLYMSADKSVSTTSSSSKNMIITNSNLQFNQELPSITLPPPIHPQHNSNYNVQGTYWNEIQMMQQQQKPFLGPYQSSMNNFNEKIINENINSNSMSYGHHRQCGYCDNYSLKITHLLNENKRLRIMNQNHQLERMKWKNKYSELLSNFQSLADIITNNNNNAMIEQPQQTIQQQHQHQQQFVFNHNHSPSGTIGNQMGNDGMSVVNIGNDEWAMNESVNLNNPMTYIQNDNDSFRNYL